MNLRRRIADSSAGASLLPNDEVVVATAARSSGKRSINIMSLFEEEFRFFRTEVKKNVDDLQREHSEPLIVHSGRHQDEFMDFLHLYWRDAIQGNEARKQHFISALSSCSIETAVSFLSKHL